MNNLRQTLLSSVAQHAKPLSVLILGAGVIAGAATLGSASTGTVSLKEVGRYSTGIFDESAAEVVDFDAKGKRLFVVNGDAKSIDVLDASDPANITKIKDIAISDYGYNPNSVAVHGDMIAVAIEKKDHTQKGMVAFYSTDGKPLAAYDVGALPDMVAFSPDGRFAVVACEGEPSDDYTIDPVGHIAVLDLKKGVMEAKVSLLGFEQWNEKIPAGARVVKPGAAAAVDFEPEYAAVSADSNTAFVTLQENNAVAIVDLAGAKIKDVVGLGYKDHSKHALDASNKDGKINIQTWPVKGMYQPDTIATFTKGKDVYFITANEGDAKDYDGWSEETRIGKLTLDPKAFPNAASLQEKSNLGRLKTTTSMGDTDGDGDHDELYSYGARSFSIWDAKGKQVFDSGDAIEKLIAKEHPEFFNAKDTENAFDDRSDDKGPEPEALAVGDMDGRTIAFIGLERDGGILVYDVTDPKAPVFQTYMTSRHFAGDPEAGTAGDLAPEGMRFIAADESPNGKPMLAVAYEVSGSTTLYEVVSK